jgi:hypothetical protein
MRIVLVLSLAAIGPVIGLLVTSLQPGHQPWPLVGLVAGDLPGAAATHGTASGSLARHSG